MTAVGGGGFRKLHEYVALNAIENNSLQFASDVITLCVYLQSLQNAVALITKCVGWIYYKMRKFLQNAAEQLIQ